MVSPKSMVFMCTSCRPNVRNTACAQKKAARTCFLR
jgi:hypothetical protein